MKTETPGKPAQADQAGNKKKMILVVVLSIGLAIALVTQPDKTGDQTNSSASSGDSQTSSSTDAAGLPPAIEAKPSETGGDWENQLLQIHHLSRMDLETITGLELLAAEPRRMRREGIRDARRVDAIYASPRGHAALLGDAIVRGGQPLPDGRRVLSVSTEGIEISY